MQISKNLLRIGADILIFSDSELKNLEPTK